MERIASLRATQERALGVAFPAVKLMAGPQLNANEYEIGLYGARHGGGDIQPAKTLAIRGQSAVRIDGQETIEPAFGLPAVWIEPAAEGDAREAGYTIVDPITVFITHLGEIVRAEAGALLTRADVVRLLDEVRARQPGLVEELVPTLLSISDVQKVMQNLLSEGVPVSAIDLVVEHLVDVARALRKTRSP